MFSKIVSKLALTFVGVTLLTSVGMADPASDDAKLASLVSNKGMLSKIEMSADQVNVTFEGSNGDTSYIEITDQGESKFYAITKNGGGTVMSINRLEDKKLIEQLKKYLAKKP